MFLALVIFSVFLVPALLDELVSRLRRNHGRPLSYVQTFAESLVEAIWRALSGLMLVISMVGIWGDPSLF